MNTEQLLVFGILAATLVLFVWNRWRYDLVALGALLAVAGLTPTDQIFAGFGHPAVVTVAAVLVLSRGLLNAGVVDTIAQSLGRVGNQPMIQVATLTGVVALCSGFMNNVGALALLMPVAIWMSRQSSRPPSLLLMPLAFGSLLGGTITLIGTPPNIIIAAYRAQTGAPPFGMFEFFPVGIGITLVGVLFISLLGWRLTPKREKQGTPEELFQIGDYISEVRVTEHSKVLGQTLHDLLSLMESESDVTIVGLFRGKQRHMAPSMYAVLQAGDILMVETDPESLKGMIDAAGLELAESGDIGKGDLGADDVSIIEAIVAPESLLLGRTAANLDMRARYGVNVLAVARQGQRVRERLSKIRFNIADILLLQGRTDSLQAALSAWGCLPLAERGLRIGKPRKVFLAAAIFVAALALVAFNLLPAQVALVGAAVVMVLSGLLTLKEAYKSIDWPIIVLLAAMIPVGQALESTGGAQLIADQLLRVARSSSPAETLAILMVGTMLLSNVVNNAAAAILMAPIAIGVAHGMGSSPDPLLMAVAIGSSCAFLTPIGHQSNALVMAPGGYRFGDYWRLGLPLSVLVVGAAVPLIMWFWPL